MRSIVQKEDPGQDRVHRSFKLVDELSDGSDARSRLKRFVAVISTLVQHSRYGGLDHKKVNKLCDVAHAILRVSRIDPESSRFRFLYGEIHLLRSQIYRAEGAHWKAAWEQHVGLRYVAPEAVDDYKFQLLAAANRLVRLAQLDLGLPLLEKVEQLDSGALAVQARLTRMIAMRVSSRSDEAKTIAKTLLVDESLTPEYRCDVEWELLAVELQKSADLTPFLRAVKKGGSHHKTVYIVECTLWGLALPSRNLINDLYSMRAMKTSKGHRPFSLGVIFPIALAIQNMYDASIPYNIRLARIGEALEDIQNIQSIDRELICWLAAARALVRTNNFDLAKLTLSRYASISMELSGFKTSDGLGIGSDLFGRSWN